ncbi:MAG: hypothetical protein ACRD40_01310 [Candidatus Acidiferrales bacterium]
MKPLSRLIILLILTICAAPSFAADANGTWVGQFTLGMNPTVHPFHLVMRSGGPVLRGTMIFCDGNCKTEKGRAPIEDGKIDGYTISFGTDTDAKDVPHIDFQGTVTGDSIQFVVSGKSPDCPESSCKIGRGSATRKPQ